MSGLRVVVHPSDLLRQVKSCRPDTYRSVRQPHSSFNVKRAPFHHKCAARQDSFPQRYGNATEPQLPPPSRPISKLLPAKQPPPSATEPEHGGRTIKIDPVGKEPESSNESKAEPLLASSSLSEEAAAKDDSAPVTPLDFVLQTVPPSEIQAQQHHHPHLEAGPYVHHFDTYSLVQYLAKGNFTEEQAVTIMKAIRLMLAENLDIAKEGLVSKSGVENETYLFRAACSELHTGLQGSRHSEIQRQRTQRAQLLYEFDILNQNVSQDMVSLREELKAMFNDRKMAVQEEKQRLDSKISELNYEITVLLNSDCKSEVEGLRWVLTRRAAMAIAVAALMTLLALNYSSYTIREREEAEKKVAAAEQKALERKEARLASRESRDQGSQTTSDYAESLG